MKPAPPRLARILAGAGLSALLCLSGPVSGWAGGADARKAAVVYNLSKFIRWPAGSLAQPDSPLSFCVLGSPAFSEALAGEVAGKTTQGRPLRVISLARAEDVLTADCHVLYLSPTEAAVLPELLSSLQGRPVLSVSDAEGFVRQGGIIGLLASGERVRFEINLDAARQSHLNISASLLGLAQSVQHSVAP